MCGAGRHPNDVAYLSHPIVLTLAPRQRRRAPALLNKPDGHRVAVEFSFAGLDRGDVVWLEFDPQAGHEQAGHRPAVVLSPRAYNQKSGLALFCPITSRIKGYPFEVVLPPDLPVQGAVLCDQAKSLDWSARRSRLAAQLPDAILDDVLAKVRALLR